MKVRLRYGMVLSGHATTLESLALIVSRAFGGGKPKPKPVENWEEAVARFSAVGGAVGGFQLPEGVLVEDF